MARNRSLRRALAERRRSAAYLPGTGPDRFTHGELYMFSEDVDHRILPIGGGSRNWPDYEASVDPQSEAAIECLRTALADDEYDRDLTSAVGGFIRRCVGLIIYQGEAYLELVFDRDNDPKRFLIAPLPPGEVRVDQGVVVQLITHEVQEARGLAQPFIEIPESDVLHLTLPDSLGGKPAMLKLTADLEYLGGSILPEFAEGDFSRLRQEFGFDVADAYRDFRDIAMGAATARIGWPGRWRLDEKITEFYLVYRSLKFAVSLAYLREHIIARLNDFVAPAMRRVGLTGALVVSGIPTSADLKAKLQALAEGALTFKEAMDYIYLL